MILHYDKKLHKSFPNKGVDIKTNQFGTTNGVDYISPFPQQNRISESISEFMQNYLLFLKKLSVDHLF